MNSTAIIGRLCRDVEMKAAGTSQVVNNVIAVDRAFKDKQGNKITDFIPVSFWGKRAEAVSKYCKKGSKVAVKGEIQVRQYEDKDGKKRTDFGINVESVYFLDGNKDAVKEEPAINSTDEMQF